MKILYLAARLPYPLEKGDKLRAYYQLRELVAQGHEVVVCALSEGKARTEDIAAVEALGLRVHCFTVSKWNVFWRIPAWLFRRQPLQIGYFYAKKVADQIQKIAERENFELVWTQMLRVQPYAENLPIARKILDLMDCLSANTRRWAEGAAAWWLRPILRREARLLADSERRAVQNGGQCFIISEQDKQLLPLAAGVRVLPNGVDFGFFSPPPMPIKPAYELAFVGNMGYLPNVEAAKFLAERILPLVHAKMPRVRLLLAGARPSEQVKALQSDKISVSGWLEDIRQAYCSAQLLVAPLFLGSGQQNKILEAMALSLPCLTTRLVNNAIGAQENQEIFLADNAEQFAEKIIFLLQNPDLLADCAAKAHSFVKEHYDWQKIMQNALQK